jgi:hypothetical protein
MLMKYIHDRVTFHCNLKVKTAKNIETRRMMLLLLLLLLLPLSVKIISPKSPAISLHLTDNQWTFDVLTPSGRVRVMLALLTSLTSSRTLKERS